MQLSDLISVEKLDAMREIASQPSVAEQYVPFLSEHARGCLTAFVGRKCGNIFWANLRRECEYAPDVIVCVAGKRADVMPVHKSAIFAKRLGAMLKRGDKIAWLKNGKFVSVNWENWESIYAALTSDDENDLPVPPSRCEMRRMRVERDRREMFYEAASATRNKKLGKRGYNMSFDEIQAWRRHEAYEKRLRGVEIEARRIISVL